MEGKVSRLPWVSHEGEFMRIFWRLKFEREKIKKGLKKSKRLESVSFELLNIAEVKIKKFKNYF